MRLLAVCLVALAVVPAAAAAPKIAPADSAAIRSVLNEYIPAMLQRKDVSGSTC
jgi:hypothetical protein